MSLTDLIESAPPQLKLLPYIISNNEEEGSKFVQTAALSSNLTFTLISKQLDFIFNYDLFPNNIDIIMSYYDGILTLQDTPCQYYLTKRSEFLSSLIPTSEIRTVVEQIKLKYYNNKMIIGIHIRTHDPVFDWSIIPPLNNDKAGNFGDGATVADFTRYLDQISGRFTLVLGTKYYRYFVASNDPQIKGQILGQYPDAISLDGIHTRTSPEGVKFAFIEWLLLAECALIINTYGRYVCVTGYYYLTCIDKYTL